MESKTTMHFPNTGRLNMLQFTVTYCDVSVGAITIAIASGSMTCTGQKNLVPREDQPSQPGSGYVTATYTSSR